MIPTRLDCRISSSSNTSHRPVIWLFILLGIICFLGNDRAIAQPPASIAWQGCGEHLECARVQVPLDWSRPKGAKIILSVVRHLASKPDQRIGSLFVNYGGPGVPGVPAVKQGGEGLDQLGDGRFDIVGWDPRGTGESTHVTCFQNDKKVEQFWGKDWTLPTSAIDSWFYALKTVEYVQRCTAMSGVSLLAHVSTMDTVRDLDYLRELVGDSKLTYRGLSYGTVLGETYINMFPQHVRAVILDGNIDPAAFVTSVEASMSTSSLDTDVVYEKFLSLCRQSGPFNCRLDENGDPGMRMQKLFARLRHSPIPAPRAPAPHQLRYGDLMIELWALLGTPAKWPQLAEDLNQAADGDGSNLATAFQDGRISILKSLVSATALQCSDKPLLPPGSILNWPQVMQRLTTSNLVGAVTGWWLWAPCASWVVPSAERYTGPWTANTQNTILIIGNRYDPRTRYGNSVLASERLRNASLLTLEGYGHTSDVDPSDCIDNAVTNYLITTMAPISGTVCQPNHTPFDPNFENALFREQPLFE